MWSLGSTVVGLRDIGFLVCMRLPDALLVIPGGEQKNSTPSMFLEYVFCGCCESLIAFRAVIHINTRERFDPDREYTEVV